MEPTLPSFSLAPITATDSGLKKQSSKIFFI